MKKIFFLLPTFFILSAPAQKQANVWYFGNKVGVDFNTNPPSALTHSALSNREGSASVCDANGALLFYTDGETVYNKSHQVMANGNGLAGSRGSTQSATIVPWPEHDSLYYIFTTDEHFNFGAKGYTYSIVNTNRKNGLGEVIVKNQLLYKQSSEKLTVARHCDGKAWWVITKKWNSNQFLCYLIDKDGVKSTPTTSTAGFLPTNYAARGYMKVSPDNALLAAMHSATFSDSYLELFKFNNSNGIVSHAIKLENPSVNGSVYGLEFSPNSRFLYTGDLVSLQVHQFDLQNFNAADIAASRLTITPSNYTKEPCALQLGPDGKIYIIGVKMDFSSDYLDVIHFPDVKGTACSFQENVLYLNSGKPNFIGLPNIVPNLTVLPPTQQPPSIKAIIHATHIDLCKRIVNFEAETDATENIRYKWHWGDGDSSEAQQYTKTYGFVKDIYNIRLTVIGDVKSCGKTITLTNEASLKVEFEKLPIAIANNDTSIAMNHPVQLQASGGVTYEWTPTTFLNNAFIANPIALPQRDQQYIVKVSNGSNCSDYDTVKIKLFNVPDIYVPNAFTPNNDGKNDILKALPVSVQLHIFAVYNRWGQIIFSTTDYRRGWNGLYNDKMQPYGTYTWVAQGKNNKGKVITRRGTVTLIR